MASMMFAECAARFLAWCEVNRAPKTVLAYKYHLDRFAKWAGPMDVADLSPAKLSLWSSKYHPTQAVQRLLSWLHREERSLSVNPLAGMRKPKSGQRRRVLERGEWVRLLRGADRTFRPFLVLMRESMCRPQEARVLRWVDIAAAAAADDQGGAGLGSAAYFAMAAAKGYAWRRDDNGERCIPISPRLARLLGRLGRRRVDLLDTILRDSRGRPWTSNAVRCRFRRLRLRVGLVADRRGECIVAYSLRHTAATFAAAAGLRDFLLAEALGHASIRTTQRYVHLKPADVCEGMKRVWDVKTRVCPKKDRPGLRRTRPE